MDVSICRFELGMPVWEVIFEREVQGKTQYTLETLET
jgi:hypothetical protein